MRGRTPPIQACRAAFAEGIAAFRAEAAERGDTARGCNITVPFKFEAAALAQHTSERATLAQAVFELAALGVGPDQAEPIGCGTRQYRD